METIQQTPKPVHDGRAHPPPVLPAQAGIQTRRRGGLLFPLVLSLSKDVSGDPGAAAPAHPLVVSLSNHARGDAPFDKLRANGYQSPLMVSP